MLAIGAGPLKHEQEHARMLLFIELYENQLGLSRKAGLSIA